ncbi:MAG: porin, partial [Paracoccaceae bacterium]
APSGFDNPTLWVAGLNLGMAGFTLGGSYGEQNGAGLMNGEVYDLGVSYETGRWGFSFTYFRGENVNNECFFGGFDACTAFGASNDEVLKQYLVGISYDLAKGVNLGAYGAFVDFDEECRDDLGDFCEGVEGWVVGSGIKIKF